MPTKEEKVSKVKQDAKRAKNNEKELEKLISETQRILDQAKSKKVIHANKAAHKKSQ
ncbi:2575_t:CDS:2 [Funneliformis geosporum]|uniref:2575_t:CDS:1 n=1 Tax=Funneliformis geosporum TaxID=1117311 RepID=A0A9W4SWT1_9GLOM|nr:2575_t:CDS:2 [Funneliformis geosporum]